MANDNIALQLYTVRTLTERDFPGTLSMLAGMGYRAVEFAGYGDQTAAELRQVLDDLDMTAVSAHIGLAVFQEQPEDALANAQTLGCDYAVIPWVGEEWRQSADRVKQLATILNRTGELCQREGLGFAYHNHWFEFSQVAGTDRLMLDLLLEQTDPNVVKLELDLGWAVYAGADPAALLQRLSGRIPLVHVKDVSKDKSNTNVPVSEGIIDWPPLLAAAKAEGVEWYIVEHDNPADPLLDSETSLKNLTRLMEAE